MQVGGIVICGGRSRRMGRPKAWLPIGDEPMLARVVRILGTVVSPIVVVAAPDQELPPLPKETRIAHDPLEGRGPLQGIAVGLSALTGIADAAYVSSCDVPFLRPDFVRRMIKFLGEHRACVPQVGGFTHPLAAVYRVDLAPLAAQLLQEDRLRPVFLFESVATRWVGESEFQDVDPSGQSLRNLNTPDDYAQALQDLAGD